MSASTHPATTGGRVSSILCAAVLAVAAAGCGLSDYQRQMAEQQRRLDQMKEEDDNLGDPLRLPDKKERPAYFFRPPLRIASIGRPHEHSGVVQQFGLMGSDPSYFQDVSFGIERMKEEDFWSSLLRSFPNRKKEDVSSVAIKSPGRGDLTFKELKSEDGLTIAYVRSQGDAHAAVIFHLTRNDETARKLMNTSLGTLTIGPDAGRMNQAYLKRKELKAEAEKRKKAAAREDQ